MRGGGRVRGGVRVVEVQRAWQSHGGVGWVTAVHGCVVMGVTHDCHEPATESRHRMIATIAIVAVARIPSRSALAHGMGNRRQATSNVVPRSLGGVVHLPRSCGDRQHDIASQLRGPT